MQEGLWQRAIMESSDSTALRMGQAHGPMSQR